MVLHHIEKNPKQFQYKYWENEGVVVTIIRCFVSYNVSVLVGLLMIISLGSSGKVFPAPIQLHWCLLLFSLFVSFIFGFSLSELNPELDGYAKMHWQKWHKMLPNGLTKISLGGYISISIQWIADLWVLLALR